MKKRVSKARTKVDTKEKKSKTKSLLDVLNEIAPQPKTSGEMARSFRVNSDFTLKEVAEITGIAYSNLSKLENDIMPMTRQYAEKIAAMHGIDPTLILYPNGYADIEREFAEIYERGAQLRREKSAGW